LIIVLWPTIFVNIQSGHAGVYFSLLFGGTDTKSVRGEGFQLKFPWDTIYDYDIRLQQVPYEFSVISGDGLQLQIRVSVRCRPLRQRLAVLQKDIGPDYVQKIVIPQTQLALRTVAGSYSAEKLYSTSRGILEEAMDKTIERLTGKYILIDQILITGVYIPEALKRAIEAKLTEQQNVLQYDYVLGVAKKEAERKRIKDFLYENLYYSASLAGEKDDAERIVTELFDFWMKNPSSLPHYYQEKAAQESLPRVVCDYIAGMTDHFIIEQYEKFCVKD